jgi:cytoskeleton protein RodZ
VFEIGNSLREARHRQQLELTEVEQATKIRARYLRALEEEAFDVLPAQTYVKGFLRTYADWLGLDGQLYVDEYNSRYGVGEDEPREPVVARRSARVHQRHRRMERRGVLLALLGIAALTGLLIAAFGFGNGKKPQAVPNLGPNTTKARVTKPSKKQNRPAHARVAKLKFFVLAAHGSSWMDVRNYSSNGRTLFTGTVDQGQSHGWTARRLWIDFGSPSNLTVVLNGKQVVIPGGGGTVAVLVTPTGIVRAPATA